MPLNIRCLLWLSVLNRLYLTTHKNESNIICSIPIDKPPFSMITYQNHNNLKYNLFNTSIRNLNLRLTDQNNNLIDLNGCHWSISIQIEVVKFV